MSTTTARSTLTTAQQAAERLRTAEDTRTPCPPVRDLVGADVAMAYEVQRLVIGEKVLNGSYVVGRKIGLTSKAVQQQLGVDSPDFGVLLNDMDVSDLLQVPSDRLLQPKVEAEIAFVLGADLDDDDLDLATVRAAVDYAVAALEIVDSRVAGWDITLADTVADNASSGLFVLGSRRVPLKDFEPAEVTMKMFVHGAAVPEGNGAACLGDPLNALVWLARTAREYGDPLRAGQVVLSGALGPMVAVTPGTRVNAQLSVLGAVAVEFSADEAEVSR